MRRVVVCADDFGQSKPVDAAILRLVRAGSLTAVSCLSHGPAFVRDVPDLLRGGVDAGLHLDLTDGSDGSPTVGIGTWVARSYLGAIDRDALRRRIAGQLDAFERAAGRAPAFVDGHRHVHQLPVIRTLLLDELARRHRAAPPLVRVTAPRRWRGAKAAIIAALGARSLRRDLAARGLPHNQDFAGVYGFEEGAPYRALVQGWLATIEDGGLLMCHPGDASDDVISAARVAEAAYLEADFEADCAAAGVSRAGVGVLAASAVPVPCA